MRFFLLLPDDLNLSFYIFIIELGFMCLCILAQPAVFKSQLFGWLIDFLRFASLRYFIIADITLDIKYMEKYGSV